MPISPTYPGVYVQEVPSGVRTIAGVSTSIAMFIGQTKLGPLSKPVLCLNYSDFVRNFSEDTTSGQMAQYVRLFFLNGGTQCYVMRIANGATYAYVGLQNELGNEVLILSAKAPGLAGENIRAVVAYGGPQPEATFNLDLFAWDVAPNGKRTKSNVESWKNLSMDPVSSLYAPTFITQNSKLVDAALGAAPPAASKGFSLSGRAVADQGGIQASFASFFPGKGPGVGFQISVNGSPYANVDLSTITASPTLATDIQDNITQTFAAPPFNLIGVKVIVTFPPGPPNTFRLKIEPATPTGDIFIRPGNPNDLAVALMLGTAQGGLEISGRADQRPAPNGISFRPTESALNDFASLTQGGLTGLSSFDIDVMKPDGTFIADTVPMTGTLPGNPFPPPPSIITTLAGDLMDKDALQASANGNSDGVREKLGIIAQRIGQFLPNVAGNQNKWKTAVVNYRLTLYQADDVDDNFVAKNFSVSAASLLADFPSPNIHYYTVGVGGGNLGRQNSAASPASDGNAPIAKDYDDAYPIIDKEVDLFNLMVLPPSTSMGAPLIKTFYGNASNFCQQRRAFLLMDPPPSWVSKQDAIDTTNGVNSLRVGLAKQYAGLFFPRITVDNGGLQINIGSAGAIAGLFARIDGTRGVWKAPAGIEADLRGIVGLEYKFSDGENGVLNPKAINTLRAFPNGIVCWGSRTMDGDDDIGSEYKYIPIRRLALFMEESLYRGLKWVVFEPNDEPLWSQIRLNVGSFMHDLFRQGAFQGQTPKDAYFVKCDAETTTQSDRNKGIVNIWVGFAPLKPAEFVILYLQQMAGQIQV